MERRADRQAGNSAMRLRTVKLSAEKSLSKRELSGSIFFLLSAFEIRRTENQRRQPDGRFIRNLTPPVAQKSGQSSSFIVSGTKILTVTAFIRRQRKMCIDLREVGGCGAITMQQVSEYTLSPLCPVDLSVTQCTRRVHPIHTLFFLRVTKISADLWHNGNTASIHPTQFCKSRLQQLVFWCVITTRF